ncbi:MAG: biopolymer transporter ExbD [Xanthomonadales bacterium]|nr:biopolymer transporter ExbD [Xanthomonadales bacterium]NIN60450.1 biopolymer transporter ExbD [Xanthomonadales bacterium]NIN75803.1 biopolymer transporter ExbD [Xanthomonadales bacterium]NIO12981.1 biopolymer transporter ExbD [Xanthomonadales bacterium]NIP12843.1 biopolymer transporter ExbD [Xanthomonadales bacterium]
MRWKHRPDDEAEINITPMLDIVFIMLIFFIVTTSFVKEKGLEVSRPSNAPPKQVEQKKGPIVLKIDASGNITLKGRLLERKAVRANLEREKAEKPDSPLIVAAHPDAETDALVTILDAAEAVKIASVSVATTSR